MSTENQKTALFQPLLVDLDTTVDEWRENFGHVPNLDAVFKVDILGMLRLNGIALCPAHHVPTSGSLICSTDLFTLSTEVGLSFDIYIEWPFDDDPYISLIAKREDIYVCL